MSLNVFPQQSSTPLSQKQKTTKSSEAHAHSMTRKTIHQTKALFVSPFIPTSAQNTVSSEAPSESSSAAVSWLHSDSFHGSMLNLHPPCLQQEYHKKLIYLQMSVPKGMLFPPCSSWSYRDIKETNVLHYECNQPH